MSKLNKCGKKNRGYYKVSDTKKQRALHFFNRNCLLLLMVILGAFAVCFQQPWELHQGVAHGAALWFLLLLGSPMLAIYSILNIVFHLDNLAGLHYLAVSNPVLGVTVLDLVYLLAVWLWIRFRGMNRMGWGGVKAAGNFVLIFACWGIFQLALSGILFLQQGATQSAETLPAAESAMSQSAFSDLPQC